MQVIDVFGFSDFQQSFRPLFFQFEHMLTYICNHLLDFVVTSQQWSLASLILEELWPFIWPGRNVFWAYLQNLPTQEKNINNETRTCTVGDITSTNFLVLINEFMM